MLNDLDGIPSNIRVLIKKFCAGREEYRYNEENFIITRRKNKNKTVRSFKKDQFEKKIRKNGKFTGKRLNRGRGKVDTKCQERSEGERRAGL